MSCFLCKYHHYPYPCFMVSLCLVDAPLGFLSSTCSGKTFGGQQEQTSSRPDVLPVNQTIKPRKPTTQITSTTSSTNSSSNNQRYIIFLYASINTSPCNYDRKEDIFRPAIMNLLPQYSNLDLTITNIAPRCGVIICNYSKCKPAMTAEITINAKQTTLCVASLGMNFKITQWTLGTVVKFNLNIISGSMDADCNSNQQQLNC